jgi:hypothetical protein
VARLRGSVTWLTWSSPVVGVLGVAARAAAAGGRVDHLLEPIELVVLVGGELAERIGEGGEVALRVVAVLGDLAGRVHPADVLDQAIERVVLVLALAGQDAGGVEDLLPGGVAHRIQGIDDLVAEVVLDLGEPVRRVIGVRQERAVGQSHLRELANAVVLITSDLAPDIT